MKVYTRTGDKGSTSLVGGTRVPKDHPRLQAYGTLDELNSWIGLVASEPATLPAEITKSLHNIQNRLFDIGTILATEPESRWQPETLPMQAVTTLEQMIDTVDATMPVHNQFVLPGGCTTAARAQVARTVARRCERQLIALSDCLTVAPEILAYINRLSDYLFVVARKANYFNKVDEIFWHKSC